MSLLKDKRTWFGVVVVAIMAALVVYAFGGDLAQAQPSSVTTQATATATTSPAYLYTGSATSTYQFDNPSFSSGKIANMGTIDGGTLYFAQVSSTSATSLNVRFQCSNNNIDWYNAESTTTLGNAVASTTYMITPISVCVTFHERVVFSINPGSPAASVYAEVDLKKNPSTP